MPTLWEKTFETLRGAIIGCDDATAKRGADAAIVALAEADADVLADQRQAAAERAYDALYASMTGARGIEVRYAPFDTGALHGPVDLRDYYGAVARQYRELRHNIVGRGMLSIRDQARMAFAMVECPMFMQDAEPTNAECDYVFERYVDYI